MRPRLVFALAATTAIFGLGAASAQASPVAETAAPAAAPAAVAGCFGTNAKLVPNCPNKILFGASSNDSVAKLPWTTDMLDAEKRYGRTLAIWRNYVASPSVPFDPNDPYLGSEARAASAAGKIVQTNWKPAPSWGKATGSDAKINADIDAAAKNIKSLGPHRVMVTIWHEPDNDVGGGTSCPIKAGNPTDNTPANYRAMWANVQKRFAAQGVTNVVWVTGYMGFPGYECLRNSMWPGDNAVDWVGFDRYWGKTGNTVDATIGQTYRWFMNNSAPGHNYASKPFGLMEFGMNNSALPLSAQGVAYQGYRDLSTALNQRTYPNLRAYVVWDSIGNGDCVRVDRAGCTTPDPVGQREFNLFANKWQLQTPAITN